MKIILAIAVGGAFGAVSRYLMMVQVTRVLGVAFPYGTLAVNIVGSFVIGLIIEMLASKFTLSPELRALLVTGFLGGFTTFSTFSLDLAGLIERGDAMTAVSYAVASVMGCLLAVFAGLYLGRLLVA